jgi:tRNA modification GTPase
MEHSNTVIFAPITGRGGAVTVVRLSGPGAFEVARGLVGRLPSARRAALRDVVFQGRVLDHALVTVFPAPNSFTGDDCVEISLHGGRAVLSAVSDALVALGARPAEPGEFSRAAFLNGKLNLLEAEAIADLIAAETEAQRRLALDGADALQNLCLSWREELRLLMAQQEALIDFPDEDLPETVEQGLLNRVLALSNSMLETLGSAPAAMRLRDGLEFVILGAPNAGKSTLLNALAGSDIAIVSEIPGTTRDAISVRLDLGGVAVNITDTAGLRDTADEIEAEGIKRARAKAGKADLLVLVAADGVFPEVEGAETLRVMTKADLGVAGDGLAVSAATGLGMDALRAALTEAALRLTDLRGGAALARPRQIACVRETQAALTRALKIGEPELRGEELRIAAAALGRLVGAMGVEEVLDAVFSGFCIGK